MPAKYIPHYTVDCRTLFHHSVLKYSYTGCKDMRRITIAKPNNSKNISTLPQKSNSRNCRWISDRLHTGFLLRLTGERLSRRCEIGSSLTGGSIMMERLCGVDDNSGPAEADEMTGVKTVIDHEGIQEIEMSDA
jgi:hypothetical protein